MKIDLNSDLGEGFGIWRMGDDEAMMKLVTSANIACGFHAGDPTIMFKTLKLAASMEISVGAHVSYPDRVGFGRRNMDISPDVLMADVIYQIGALEGLAKAAGTTVNYVKPHGALYNTIAHSSERAEAVINAIKALNPRLALMVPAASPLEKQALDSGLRIIREVFADRAYTPGGALVPRTQRGAVLHSPKEVVSRITGLLRKGTLTASDGSEIMMKADSICIHGDTAGSVEMASAIRRLLLSAGITLAAATGEET
ncbi:LamB/YcsF family protein [Serratia marcescens]|nr:LamB/YcsF family protein [Serratia marcescens]MBH2865967.1 LamB/YcsF family protein [Serratia marcescens]